MEEKIKEITIEELLQLYRAIEEHQEYLENEKKKLEEEVQEW